MLNILQFHQRFQYRSNNSTSTSFAISRLGIFSSVRVISQSTAPKALGSSRVWEQDELREETDEKSVYPIEGSLICSLGTLMIFFTNLPNHLIVDCL